jgi:hypothetical protein
LSLARADGWMGAAVLLAALNAHAGSSASFAIDGDSINAGASYATSGSNAMQACLGSGGGEASSSSFVLQTGCGAVLATANAPGPPDVTAAPVPAASDGVLAALGALLALIGLSRLRTRR